MKPSDVPKGFSVTKIILWLLILLSLSLPMGLATLAFIANRQIQLPARYSHAATDLSDDPVIYDSYRWIGLGSYRVSISSQVYPSLIILVGAIILLLGVYLLLHTGTGSTVID